MKKICSKTGDLLDLKNTISLLQDFTGYIVIDNGILFYKDSKLIFSIYNHKETDLKYILKKLPELFLIEIYKCSIDELNDTIQNELNSTDNLKTSDSPGDDAYEKDRKQHNIDKNAAGVDNDPKYCMNVESDIKNVSNSGGILLSKYNDLQKHVGTGIYLAILKPRRYKLDKGFIIFKDCEEFCAIYYGSKGKILEGKKALGKIKTIFAVSDVNINVKKISLDILDKFLKEHSNSILKTYVSFDELMCRIREKKYREVKNDSLSNVLTKKPSLIEIKDNNMYIVSNEKKPVYAFFNEYDGDKSYRHIKNFCIFNNITFKVYNLSDDEFKLFKEFKKNKINK